MNGQQTQFQPQPVRNAGSLSFSDAVSAVSQPSFFQQAPLQRSPQQQPQPFNFFPGSSTQQQRFRPIVQQDSTENFDEPKIAQPSLILQQSSQERFLSDSPRRPLQQSNGARNPSNAGSGGWWNPTTDDAESVVINSDEESSDRTNTKDDVVEFNQQRQNQQKRGRGQPQQGKRRPLTTPVPSSIPLLDEQQEPAAIGFTVIHDENDDRSSWSQPIITTHRPQLGQTSFRTRNLPTAISGSNRRPTTYNPLSVTPTLSTSVRVPNFQPSASTITVNRQQPTTIRSRKLSQPTTTTTASNLEDEQEQEEQPAEEKRQFLPRKSTSTTQLPPVPITTLRPTLKPRLNTPIAAIPQQQRMKKIVNNPATIQNIVTRKPILTSTSTLAPTTTTNKEEEYEDYEDIEYTTTAYKSTEIPSNKKLNKPLATQASTITNQKNNNSATTESWVVVASVQTSRSVSSSSSMLGGGTNKNLSTVETTTSSANTNKHRFNNKSTISSTSTTTVESIIDKLDRVQSELSNGILYGSSSNTNNRSRILTDVQNSGNSDDKRNDVTISSITTPTIIKMTESTVSTTIPTTTTTTTTSTSTTTTLSPTVKSSTTVEREEDENEDEDKEEEDSDDSEKETTFVRKFIPSKSRTTTVSAITTTSTVKPLTQIGKKKSLVESVKFDELLTSGLLPPGFNPKPPPAYKSKIITTSTSETPSSANSNSSFTINTNTTPSSPTTTVKAKSSGLNIKFVDDSSALAALLPPGFKLEEAIKPVETLSPSLLPPGFKLPLDNTDKDNLNKEAEAVSISAIPTTDLPISTTTKVITSSTTGLVFPNNNKGMNNTGTRKPLPSNKKMQASVTVAPVIQKGWPVR